MNSNKLIDLREEKNLKSKDMAEVFGVNKSTYSEWENDKIPIPTRRIIQLSEYHKTNIDYIMKLSSVRKEMNPTTLDLKLIGKRLHEVRIENKLSLRDLSKKLNTSFSALAYYERGERLIKSDTLFGISKLGGYSIDWLLGKSDDKYLKKRLKLKKTK